MIRLQFWNSEGYEVSLWRSPSTFNHFNIFTAGDQLVVHIGVSHISLPLQEIQSREWEEREQTNKTNNMPGVNLSAERELCNTAFPVYICRLTLAWILAKILQRYWNADSSPLTVAGPYLMPTRLSAVRCRLVTLVTLRQLQLRAPFFQLSSRVPFPLPVTRDLQSKTLCLVSRQNRQRNRLLGGPPT